MPCKASSFSIGNFLISNSRSWDSSFANCGPVYNSGERPAIPSPDTLEIPRSPRRIHGHTLANPHGLPKKFPGSPPGVGGGSLGSLGPIPFHNVKTEVDRDQPGVYYVVYCWDGAVQFRRALWRHFEEYCLESFSELQEESITTWYHYLPVEHRSKSN